MARFDAELYLRLAGEELLLTEDARNRGPWDSPLFEPAAALVAVGAISAAKARAVIDDYSLALAVRTNRGQHMYHHIAWTRASRSRRTKVKPLKSRRVVPCDRTVEHPSGTFEVHRVSLSEDATSLAITWRPKPSTQVRSGRRRHRMFHYGPTGPPDPKLTDDRGTTVGSGFGGGGSDEEWEGHLTAERPLSPDTAWIGIDGERVELTGQARQCDVAVEPLPEEPVAHRYLWRRLASSTHFHDRADIEPAIDALLAAGALETDDPALSEIRLVREALPDHPGMQPGRPRRLRELSEPWRSLLGRQGRTDGQEGALALEAVTPEFDGFSVAVSSLEAHPEGFGIEVDVAPGFETRGPFGRSLDSIALVWWAADDRGNHYLGQNYSSSGGEDHATGDIAFWPPLHPRARRLDIMPTAANTRAVIRVPLSWTHE